MAGGVLPVGSVAFGSLDGVEPGSVAVTDGATVVVVARALAWASAWAWASAAMRGLLTGDGVGQLALHLVLELLLLRHELLGLGLLPGQVGAELLLLGGGVVQGGQQVGVDLLRGEQVVDHLLAVPDLDRGVPVAAGQVPLATVERQRHGVAPTAHVRDQGVAHRLGAAGRLDLARLGESAARGGHLLVELAAAHLGLVELLTEVRDAPLEVGELVRRWRAPGRSGRSRRRRRRGGRRPPAAPGTAPRAPPPGRVPSCRVLAAERGTERVREWTSAWWGARGSNRRGGRSARGPGYHRPRIGRHERLAPGHA